MFLKVMNNSSLAGNRDVNVAWIIRRLSIHFEMGGERYLFTFKCLMEEDFILAHKNICT